MALAPEVTAEELYLAANPSDQADLTLVGISGVTTYTITDLDSDVEIASDSLEAFDVVTVDVDNVHHLAIRTSAPLLSYLGYDCCAVGGSSFLPTISGHGRVGRSFAIYLPVQGIQSDLVVFAVEDATVAVLDEDEQLLSRRFVPAGRAWFAFPAAGATPYLLRASGDVAVMTSAVNGLASVPPADRALACDNDVGRRFMLATHSWGGGAVAVFAYDDSEVVIEPLGSGEPTATTEVLAGQWLYVDGMMRRTWEVRSTADIAVWAGDLEGGETIADMGDDFSINLGRDGTDLLLHTQNHGATVLAPHDGTVIEIDGEGHELDALQWLELVAGETLRLESTRPVVAMTYGGNSLNDWGGFLRPAPPLDPTPESCPVIDVVVPDWPPETDGDADIDGDADTDGDGEIGGDADSDVDETEEADRDVDPTAPPSPRPSCDCRSTPTPAPSPTLIELLTRGF